MKYEQEAYTLILDDLISNTLISRNDLKTSTTLSSVSE